MKTAVEWLVDELTLPEYGDNPQWVQDAIKKAKEMERQQIIDAHSDWVRLIENLPTRTAQTYYNETFNP
jgi:hypothetical protein